MALRAMSRSPSIRATPASVGANQARSASQCCWRRPIQAGAGSPPATGARLAPSQCPVEQGGHAGFGQSLDGHGQALLGPLHPVHVLLQVGHSLGFDVGEHRVVGGLLTE